MTRETVIGATPARFAMSTMVGRRFFSASGFAPFSPFISDVIALSQLAGLYSCFVPVVNTILLWSVSDQAKAELMTKFYRRVLVDGERPAAALRAAQVEMWKDKRLKAPSYWAAFTFQGEW
jgi:hypothetical protein